MVEQRRLQSDPLNARRPWLAAFAVVALSAALSGCLTLPRASFNAAQQAEASPIGFPDVRYAEADPALADMLGRTLRPDANGVVNVLAMSGGGANGAYGAGLLDGWSKTGRRPQFQLVTGVSTGALAAPFAFLGSEWNARLRGDYADPKIHHLLQSRGLLGLLTPGLYRKGPLHDLVSKNVTDDLLRAVAAEHAKGRRLLVATTNLDTGQLIIWDMGAIATRGGPAARSLFVEVLVASASIPGVFSPTMIAVTGQGRSFAEMHVDGQADSAFFAIPETVFLGMRPAGPLFHHRLFIIVNGQLDSAFAVTPRATGPILGRTVAVAAKASTRSAMITTLEFCQRNGCELSVAALPPSEKDDPLDFTEAHIQSLLSAGEAAAETGRAWSVGPAAVTPSAADDGGGTALGVPPTSGKFP
jgi:predicted acylesterase/phospholipase RssA